MTLWINIPNNLYLPGSNKNPGVHIINNNIVQPNKNNCFIYILDLYKIELTKLFHTKPNKIITL